MDNVRKVLAKDNVDKSKMMYQGQTVLREYGCIQNCEETTEVPLNDDIKWRDEIDDGFEKTKKLDTTPRALRGGTQAVVSTAPGCLAVQNHARDTEDNDGHFRAACSGRKKFRRRMNRRDHRWPGRRCRRAKQAVLL